MIATSNGIKHAVTSDGNKLKIKSSITATTCTDASEALWASAGQAIKEVNSLRLWQAFYGDISDRLVAMHTLACRTHAPQDVVEAVNELLLLLEDNRREAMGLSADYEYTKE